MMLSLHLIRFIKFIWELLDPERAGFSADSRPMLHCIVEAAG